MFVIEIERDLACGTKGPEHATKRRYPGFSGSGRPRCRVRSPRARLCAPARPSSRSYQNRRQVDRQGKRLGRSERFRSAPRLGRAFEVSPEFDSQNASAKETVPRRCKLSDSRTSPRFCPRCRVIRLRPMIWLPGISMVLTLAPLSARLRCAECGGPFIRSSRGDRLTYLEAGGPPRLTNGGARSTGWASRSDRRR